MRFLKLLPFCIIYNLIFCGSIEKCQAQNKFEFGIRFDDLIIPVNINTYRENGPGYYDIHGKGNITHAAYADFTYWFHPNYGFSFGMGMRRFSSEIQYNIPDPTNEEHGGYIFETYYPYSARGLGPVVSVHFRRERFRASIGLGIIDLYNQKNVSVNRGAGVSVFDGQEVVADINLIEESYWRRAPTIYDLIQFNAQYNIMNNVFFKLGFETTASGRNFYLYSLKITGFTENTTKVEQVLNDFKMQNTFASFSAGIGYIIGFGKYKRIKKEEEN